jgi:hypothetical protein
MTVVTVGYLAIYSIGWPQTERFSYLISPKIRKSMSKGII